MELAFPGLCFLTSSVLLKFNTDGHSTLFEPSVVNNFDPEHILVLTDIHVQLFGLQSIKGVSLFNSIAIPEDFKAPQIYDGTQDLCGKRILILMLNGWGDTILIQPALQAFYKKNTRGLPFLAHFRLQHIFQTIPRLLGSERHTKGKPAMVPAWKHTEDAQRLISQMKRLACVLKQ